MRSKRALINTIVALFSEIAAVICGLILPRIILGAFGSEYNGITQSITQFLSFVTLLRSGIGGVTRAALYKPLADKDDYSISSTYNATSSFMKKVAYIYGILLLVFAVVYPLISNTNLDFLFTATLVLIIGSSTFVDSYLGITNYVLLDADQKSYVNLVLQTGTTILNTIVAALLIYFGAGIHLVKLGSALVTFIRPIGLSIYVHKNYHIDPRVKKNNRAISQRWDAFWHQVAWFINSNTDVILLTLFKDIKLISVYAIFHQIVNALYRLERSFFEGTKAAFGNMMANREDANIQRNFRAFELLIFTTATWLFTVCGVLIIPFIKVYTRGITDISYIRPTFGWIICVSEFMLCLGFPYQMLAETAGHFRQTKIGAFLQAGSNVLISFILVFRFDLVGVAIGTLFAMSFRTFYYAIYSSNRVIKRSISVFLKRFIISIIEGFAIIFVCEFLKFNDPGTYLQWAVQAVFVAVLGFAIVILFTFAFYRKDLSIMVNKIKNSIISRKKT